jgi:DNA-binding beta-propeller fold protein YncE
MLRLTGVATLIGFLCVGTASASPLQNRTPLTSPGSQLWASQYSGGTYVLAEGVSPDGTTVYVTGSGGGFLTVAYRSGTGRLLWTARGATTLVEASSIEVSPDGSKVFVAGYGVAHVDGDDDYATVAFDATTGAELWDSRYDSSGGGDTATSLGVSPDGTKVFVTGSSANPGGQTDIASIAYDATTGRQLWVSRYDGPTHLSDVAQGLVVSPDGNRLYVTGWTTRSDYVLDALTVAYDAPTGAQLWVADFNGPSNGEDIAQAIAVSPDGSAVYVAGNSGNPLTGQDFLTVAYEALTGAQKWASFYDSPPHSVDLALAVKSSPDGTLAFVTGVSSAATSTVAYAAATGVQVWSARLSIADSPVSACRCLEVSPDGRSLYVAATSSGSDYQIITAAYRTATGQLRWVAQYNGALRGFDSANALAITPGGGLVLVAGESTGARGFVFATVAFIA